MKKLYSISLFVILLIVTGCKKDDVEPAYYVYATVGNESFKYEGSLYKATSSWSSPPTFIVAAYPDGGDKELVFTTTTSVTGAPKTMKINYSSYSKGNGKYYTGGTGSCTITKFDGKVVEGTFSFELYENVFSRTGFLQVKDGRFRLKYT